MSDYLTLRVLGSHTIAPGKAVPARLATEVRTVAAATPQPVGSARVWRVGFGLAPKQAFL